MDGSATVGTLDDALGATGVVLAERRLDALLDDFDRLAHAPAPVAADLSVAALAALAAVDWEECGTGAQARRAVAAVLDAFRAHAPDEATAEDSLVEDRADIESRGPFFSVR